MRPRFAQSATVVAMALVMAACSGGTDAVAPAAPTVAGSWAGTFSDPGISTPVQLVMTVNEANGTVSGTGSLGIQGVVAIPLTVAGTFSGSVVKLTLDSAGNVPVMFVGTVNGNVLTGSLAGSGFNASQVVLTR